MSLPKQQTKRLRKKNGGSVPPLYPAALDLHGEPVLVVGGGAVAARKVGTLLACGARVTVVSPALHPDLSPFGETGEIVWVRQPFDETHLQGQRLVFACTNDAAVNAQVAALARQAGAWVNVADDSAPGDFTVPAAVRHEGLLVAVNTAAPALSRKIREELDGQFHSGYSRLVEFVQAARRRLQQEVADQSTRGRILHRFLQGASTAELAAMTPRQLEDRLDQCISSFTD